jgi:hypothetical protein
MIADLSANPTTTPWRTHAIAAEAIPVTGIPVPN